MIATPLSPQFRRQSLERLRHEHFDLLIVGGGVVGAGVALDAATRGLSVALVEARDFASGTSSQSSKLIHGGLRYLEMLDFGLVAEALAERGLLATRLAPHLVRPVPFLYPLRHRGWERLYTGAGVALYDAMASVSGRRGGLPWHRHLGKRRTFESAPALREDRFTGALLYYDAQVDDARHTLSLARTAATYGAVAATHTCVTSLLSTAGRVTGAEIRDDYAKETFTVTAGCTVNATGVWAEDIESMTAGTSGLTVRASKGVHLLVRGDRIRSRTGMIVRAEKSVLFIIPWKDHWLIGTTDTDWPYQRERPSASSSDIDYLLRHVNEVLRAPLSREDVVAVYTGLRPLLSSGASETTRLSREHAVSHPVQGLVSVAGGKYTTYRLMAKDAVDTALSDLRLEAETRTDVVPLVGAEGYGILRDRASRIGASYNISVEAVMHLLNRYGSMIFEVLGCAASDPNLLRPVPGATRYLSVEAVYAASHEGALHLEDTLTRRMRVRFETADRGAEAAAHVASVMAPVLGWTDRHRDAEIGSYLEDVAAEAAAQEAPDDAAADAARTAPIRATMIN